MQNVKVTFRLIGRMAYEKTAFAESQKLFADFGPVTHGGVYHDKGLVCRIVIAERKLPAFCEFVQDRTDNDDCIALKSVMKLSDILLHVEPGLTGASSPMTVEDYLDALCSECGERNDDGEGYDGLCGACADSED